MLLTVSSDKRMILMRDNIEIRNKVAYDSITISAINGHCSVGISWRGSLTC